MDTDDCPPIYRLPQDTLHTIFLHLPLRQIIISRSISKPFLHLLTSPSFLHLLSLHHPRFSLLSLRPPHHHHHHHHHHLLSYDPLSHDWLKFNLSFLPFLTLSPVTSSSGLLYLWAESTTTKSLIVCNPLTSTFRHLPPLGSAWSKHGTVLSGPPNNQVLVLTELATLYHSPTTATWLKFSSNLPSKPRSPILINHSLYALCDVGSPWRNLWKLFTCALPHPNPTRSSSLSWARLERNQWGDVFDILKRPRLVKGVGNRILMVGGLKSSFSLNAACSTILILRLDMEILEWDEAGRMPLDMYKCFQESSKFKVFGAGHRVCFSAKRVGKLALWDNTGNELNGEWRWIDAAPGFADTLFRGFVFDARLTATP